MRKLVLMVLCFCCIAITALAQKTTVTGKVTDPTGQPIPGATIMEKGTKNGTVANSSGEFTMSVDSKSKLVISATGFENVEVAATANVAVSLSTNTKDLSEIVVTAMGIKREKKAVSAAVQEIKGE